MFFLLPVLEAGPFCPNLHRKQRRRYRQRVIATNQVCAYCRCRLTEDNASLDHVVPVSRGGTHRPENLLPACVPCNQVKANRTLDEWLEHLAWAAHRHHLNQGSATHEPG